MATMTNYSFTQQVDYPEVLIANVQASSIATPIVNIETSGSGPTMSVLVWFSDVLSATDQIALSSIMSTYINTLPSNQQQMNKMFLDIGFGIKLIAQFGAANRAANLNTSQIIQISQQLASIQSLLLSGSIETSLAAIQSLTPSSLLTQDTINFYVSEIQNYLNGNNE
jgi:hypothetical protein